MSRMRFGSLTMAALIFAAAAEAQTFTPASIAVNTDPLNVAVGDFNADGKPDLAVSNSASDNVKILLGDGSGGYTAGVTLPVTAGSGPRSIAVADFNRDGKSDLAVSSSTGSGNKVTVFWADSSVGTFELGTTATVGGASRSLAAGDFNGDGNPDIVTANMSSNNVSILLGTGVGTFGSATNIAVGTSPQSVVVGDFNRDGKADIAVANATTDNVSVLLGDGAGGFGTLTNFTVGDHPQWVATGDVNGDGRADLVVANQDANTVSILLGNGSGSFTSTASSPAAGTSPESIAIGDLNGDGKADLAISNFTGDLVNILLGNGNGTFGSPTGIVTATGSFCIRMADLNGDGRPDLVATSTSTDSVHVLLNTTPALTAKPLSVTLRATTANTNTATVPVSVSATNSGSTYSAKSNQIWLTPTPTSNATGSPSTITLSAAHYFPSTGIYLDPGSNTAVATYSAPGFLQATTKVNLQVTNPSGILSAATGSPFDVGLTPSAVTVADFNGDGRPDLAFATQTGTPEVSVMLATFFVSGFNPAVKYPTVYVASAMAAGDFNGDGRQDIVTVGQGICVLLGNSSGGFTQAAKFSAPTGTYGSVAVADFDGDGRSDIAVTNTSDDTVRVFRGAGTGYFEFPSTLSVEAPVSVAAGDLNGDGKPDLAVASLSGITIYLANNFGVLTRSATYSASGLLQITIEDFNEDGNLDVTTQNGSGFSVYLGDSSGSGSLGAPVTRSVAGVNRMATGDLDGDGKLDIVLSGADSKLHIFLGLGIGTFGTEIALTGGPGDLAMSDFDGDGRTDLAVVHAATSARVFLGAVAQTVSSLTTDASLPATYGDLVSVAFTLTNTSVLRAPTGVVKFYDNGVYLIQYPLLSSPSVSFRTSGFLAGDHLFTATYSGDDRNLSPPASSPLLIHVNQAPQNITFNNPGSIVYSATPFAIGATASSGLAVSFSSATPAICTVADNMVTTITGGQCSIEASQPGNLNYLAATPVVQTFTVIAAPQTITFNTPGNVNAGNPPFTITATASSGLPVGFTSNSPSICTVTGNSVTIVSPGLCSITASQPGNIVFTPATAVTRTFSVFIASQSINFPLLHYSYPVDSSAALSATASSGLPVTFTSTTPSICTISGSFAVLKAGGTCSITATQTGNTNYLPAPSITRSFFSLIPSGSMGGAVLVPQITMQNPGNAAAADFDGDGLLDIAAPDFTNNSVQISLSASLAPLTISLVKQGFQSPGPLVVAAGDLNSDGKVDLAVGNTTGGTCVLLGMGGGAFASPVYLSTGPRNSILKLADLNNDGRLDFLIGRSDTNLLTFWRGDGTGGIGSALLSNTGHFIAVGQASHPIPAVAMIDTVSGVVFFYGGGLTGGFPAANVQGAAFGDFNNDGAPDIAMISSSANTVTVRINASGVFVNPQTFSTGAAPQSVVASDFNGDGLVDLAVADKNDNAISVLLGNGDGTFQPRVSFPVNGSPVSIVAADLYQSGRITLVAATQGGSGVFLLAGVLATPATTLSTTAVSPVPYGTSVPVTAAVQDSNAFNTPTGLVSIMEGQQFIASTGISGTVNLSSLSAGTHTLHAEYPGDARHNPSQSNILTITVTGLAQTINFGTPSDVTFGIAPISLSATASSGLAVSFSSTTPAVCTVAGNTATIVSAGTCSIAAIQEGGGAYFPAPSVTRSFNIAKANQSITFDDLPAVKYGVAPFTVSATATSGLTVSFVSTTLSVCTVAGNTVTVVATGSCRIGAVQYGNSNYNLTSETRTFTVSKALQTIAFDPLPPSTYGAAPFTVSATASSGLAVSFSSVTSSVCTEAGNIVTIIAAGTCSIAANRAGDANYFSAATVTQSFTVAKAAQFITFDALPDVPLGTASLQPPVSANSGLAVSLSSSTTLVCIALNNTVSIFAIGSCSIVAKQSGNANYLAAPDVTRTFNITPRLQSISSGVLPAVTFGTPPVALYATATSGLPVSFASDTPLVCTVAGNTLTVIVTGACSLTASQPGGGQYGAAPPVTWILNVLHSITFLPPHNSYPLGSDPVALSATSTSGLPVTFTSNTPSVCSVTAAAATLIGPGACTITASQPGNSAGAAMPVSRTFSVLKPSGTLSMASAPNFTTTGRLAPPADFDGDGKPDLAAARDNEIRVNFSNGTVKKFPVILGFSIMSITTGDLNKDGNPDIVVGGFPRGLGILLGTGNGSFDAPYGFLIDPGISEAVNGLAVADFDGDGNPDVAATLQNSRTILVYGGDGAGHLNALPLVLSLPGAFGDSLFAMRTDDLNRDGRPDLIAQYAGKFYIHLWNIGGAILDPGCGPNFALADFNGDGVSDFAAQCSNGTVKVLPGNGAGGFGSPATYATGQSNGNFAAADLNGDGIPDLAFSGSNGLSALIGNGTGGFAPALALSSEDAASTSITAADFDQDGRIDLVLSNGTGYYGALAATTTTLSAAQTTVTALVTDTRSFNAPTGSVVFSEGATILGSVAASPWTLNLANLSPGTHIVRADYSGDSRHTGSQSSTITITIAALSQTISFGTLPDLTYGVVPFQISATASSGLPVSFSSTTPAVCNVASNTVTLISAGTCSITANQPGDSTYSAAEPVIRSFTVNKATPVLTWAQPAAIAFGSALGSGQLNAAANIAGTFAYTPAAGVVLPAGNQTLSVAFTPTDTARYSSASLSTSITVNPPAGGAAKLVVTNTLSRSNGNIVVVLTLANTGGATASNVVVTALKIGATSGVPLPVTVGDIAAGGSAQVTITVPGSAGAAGASGSISINGSYAGGTFSSSGRITLP